MATANDDDRSCLLMFDIDGSGLYQSPAGQLYLQKNSLVFEFLGQNDRISIPKSQVNSRVQFFEDCIRLSMTDSPEKTLILIPDTKDSKGRFAFYSLRSWSQQLAGKTFAKPPAPYLRFDDIVAKIFILFQLALPFLIYYVLSLINNYQNPPLPLLQHGQEEWGKIVFSPLVGVHYLFLVLPALFAVIWSHRWAILWVTIFSFIIVFGILIYCIAMPGNEYQAWFPYMVGMAIPAFYYIYPLNKYA